MWPLRRWFWNRVALFKYHHSKPDVIPVPVADRRPVRPVPLQSVIRAIDVVKVRVGDHVPKDEAQRGKLLFARFQVLLYRLLPAMQRGLPAVDPDAERALEHAYTPAHRRCFRAPDRPAEVDAGAGGGPDLGLLAVASPYACYLERVEDGRYRWDFSMLDKFECHPGLRPPAAVVEFAVVDGSDGAGSSQLGWLEAVAIDCDTGSSRPGDADWDLARRLALCAATTHLSLIRHFQWVHLGLGGPLAMATRNELPATHPVRRLLWPHVFGTQYSNEMITRDLVAKGGDFDGIFSFTHAGLCDLLDATAEDADLRAIHPLIDAQRRGIDDGRLATPAADNRSELFEVMLAYTRGYLNGYYPSDAELGHDEPMLAWLASMTDLVANGVAGVAGGAVTVEGVAQLLAAAIYLASVEHEIVGSGVWDYQLWTDVQPVRVAQSGGGVPVDVYQRLVNANFNLNIRRTPLFGDYTDLALDSRGAAAMRSFQTDLHSLQQEYDGRPHACWRMEPKFLKANINA